MMENREIPEDEAREIAKIAGLAALNTVTYQIKHPRIIYLMLIWFTSFEGKTGPYILYTIVRIKSILKNYEKVTGSVIENGTIRPYDIESQINLMLEASKFNETIANDMKN